MLSPLLLLRRDVWLKTGIISLLTLGILAAGFYFDAHSIAFHGGWLSKQLIYADRCFRLFLTFGAALIAIEHSRWLTAVRSIKPLQLQPWLFLHLLGFAAFIALSAHLEINGDQKISVEKFPKLATVWVLLIPAFLLPWLRMFLPFGQWSGFLWKIRFSLLTAGVISVLTWTVSHNVQNLWPDFYRFTLRIVYFLLDTVYSEVIYSDSDHIIGTPDFLAEVTKECSGYEGIGLISVFLVSYLLLFRFELRFPHALLILPISLTVIWLFNAFRITLLIVIGSSWSPEIAMHGFHSQAGWIAFILVSFAAMWLLGRSPFFSIQSEQQPPANAGFEVTYSRADALIVPFLLLIAGGMVATAFSDGESQFLYPVKIIAAGLALWCFRRSYQNLIRQWNWQSALIGLLVFAIWILLEPSKNATSDWFVWLKQSSEPFAVFWLFFRIMGSVLLVPIVEELFFRGYLIRKLIAFDYDQVDPRRFTWFSLLLSSFLFGLLHQRWLAGSLAGAAFAYAQYRQGRLSDAVIAHVTANALIALAVLGFDQWHLWS